MPNLIHRKLFLLYSAVDNQTTDAYQGEQVLLLLHKFA